MKTTIPAFLVLALAACASAPAGNSDALARELLAMEARDQELRGASPIDVPAVMAADAAHTARMKAIIAEHGWPSASKVGAEAASAAWLLVQHADADPAFQRSMLELMAPMLATGEIKPQHYAYLWDRTHEPQKYGTQGKCEGASWVPRAIEDPARVDAERAAMKMPPLAEYAAMASEMCAGVK